MVAAPDPAVPDGEDAAFDRLFTAYYDRLRRFTYRYLRSWEEAEDIVHDVFVRLWARRPELGAIGDPGAYLYTAARNRALSRLKHLAHEERWRTRQRTRQHGPPAGPSGPEQQLAQNEIAAALQRGLDSLTPRQRDVILLQWRGRTYDEIGATLGISPKTVSVHVSRALEALRAALAPMVG
jgi:RNA polymerase sigma-70 factor (family 1)